MRHASRWVCPESDGNARQQCKANLDEQAGNAEKQAFSIVFWNHMRVIERPNASRHAEAR